jgi:hypothetical protein
MKHQTDSLEHASVRQYCKAVRVPMIGANFLTLAEQAVTLSVFCLAQRLRKEFGR